MKRLCLLLLDVLGDGERDSCCDSPAASGAPHGVDAAVGNDEQNLRLCNGYDFPLRIEAFSVGGRRADGVRLRRGLTLHGAFRQGKNRFFHAENFVKKLSLNLCQNR